jgi:hypothetical protein
MPATADNNGLAFDTLREIDRLYFIFFKRNKPADFANPQRYMKLWLAEIKYLNSLMFCLLYP